MEVKPPGNAGLPPGSVFQKAGQEPCAPGIPAGYKQTEVGVIPEEWAVKTLGSLTILLTNGFVGTATTAYVETDDGVLYIQGYNVQENGFDFHGIKRVSKEFHARNKKSCLQSGDLLTIQTGDIGVTTVVPPVLAGANCHALVISRLRKQESEPGYYCQYFNSERGRVAFKEIETGTTMKHLNGGDMKRLFLPSPPVEEQRAIAEALSDVDGLLSGLDRLIAKKRNLKQAAMQQLLTGQTRLPGFSTQLKSGTMADLLDQRVPRSAPPGTSIATFLGMEDLSEDGTILQQHLLPMAEVKLGLTYFERGDVLVAKITPCFENGKGAFLGSLQTASGYGSTEFHVLRAKGIGDPRYVYYQTRMPEFRRKLENEMTGTAGQKRVPRSAIFSYELPVIHDSPEQTAIAEVLTAMDAELTALEQRREKTRALKQAMMQELLTGRTRLV